MRSEIQNKSLNEAISKYGSQSNAVVALAKGGLTNAKISFRLGLSPSSVSNAKNTFLISTEGSGWKVNSKGIMKMQIAGSEPPVRKPYQRSEGEQWYEKR